MSIIQFFRLLNRNLNLLLLSSLALAILVFFFTRNLPQTYESKTEIYTGLASGPSVESLGATRVDFMTTSNEFDNLIYVIKSEQTLDEVGQILLARHLLMLNDKDQPDNITEQSREFLNKVLPPKVRDTLIVAGSETMTVKNIKELNDKHYKSWLVKTLFDSQNSPYSFLALSNVTVKRISNSDLIEVKYAYSDPYICQQTLSILNDVFANKLLDIKIGQSNDIVKYFKKQVEEAHLDLMNAEETLKDFRIEHNIINYDQQTQNIAGLQGQLEQQYQEELRAKAAAQASVNQLEEKLKLNKKIIEFSDELLSKRKKLANIRQEIAKLEILYKNDEKLDDLKKQAADLEAELSNNLTKRYEYSQTKEGVSNKSLLAQWLSATLQLDASKARLEVLANRNSYFKSQYNQLSPLGSELGRLERAVSLAESKYLELNHSLNLALTKQQSESLSTGGIVVTVPPKLPLEPEKSRQLLLVLVAAVIGFIVPFGLLIVIEFLDTTVRSPVRGEELTGLKMLGAYPDLEPKSEYKNVDMAWLKEKSMGHIIQNLRLENHKMEASGSPKGRSILIFSTRDREGRSLITHLIANELAELDKKVLVISYKDYEFEEGYKYDHIKYDYDNNFLKAKSLDEVVPESIKLSSYDYIFTDIKGVLVEQYPIELVENFDLAICVVSAKRSWNKADKFALSEFKAVLKSEPRLLVNAVEPDFMDSVLGEIEKSRSALRKFLKSVITLQFRFDRRKEKRKIKA